MLDAIKQLRMNKIMKSDRMDKWWCTESRPWEDRRRTSDVRRGLALLHATREKLDTATLEQIKTMDFEGIWKVGHEAIRMKRGMWSTSKIVYSKDDQGEYQWHDGVIAEPAGPEFLQQLQQILL